jgi:hypothetical protein
MLCYELTMFKSYCSHPNYSDSVLFTLCRDRLYSRSVVGRPPILEARSFLLQGRDVNSVFNHKQDSDCNNV